MMSRKFYAITLALFTSILVTLAMLLLIEEPYVSITTWGVLVNVSTILIILVIMSRNFYAIKLALFTLILATLVMLLVIEEPYVSITTWEVLVNVSTILIILVHLFFMGQLLREVIINHSYLKIIYFVWGLIIFLLLLQIPYAYVKDLMETRERYGTLL
jgi:hypothetical protein